MHTRAHTASDGVFVLQNQVVDSGSGLTQGDKLRALKSRRPPRYSMTGAARYRIMDKRAELPVSHVSVQAFKHMLCFRLEEMMIHGRSASQPPR